MQILHRRFRNTNNGRREELLVQWTDQTLDEATWELKDVFVSVYPDFNLEDKIPHDTGSNVTLVEVGQNVLGSNEIPETGPSATNDPTVENQTKINKRNRKAPG